MDIRELSGKSIEEIFTLKHILIDRPESIANYTLNTVSKDVIENEVIYLESYDVYGIWKFTKDNVCYLLFIYKDILYIAAFDAIFRKEDYADLIEGAKMFMEYYCEDIDINEYSESEDSWEELWTDE